MKSKVQIEKLTCSKHWRVLIGKDKCVDCEREKKQAIRKIFTPFQIRYLRKLLKAEQELLKPFTNLKQADFKKTLELNKSLLKIIK